MTNQPADGDYGSVRCKGGIVLEGTIHVDESGLCAVYLAKAVGEYQKGDFYPVKWDGVAKFVRQSP
jgi:hypothetical protein